MLNSYRARDASSILHPNSDALSNEEDGSLVISRGDGVYVIDEDGNRYLESMAGLWCVSLGFGQERLAEAAATQMRKLGFSHSFFQRSNEPQIELAEKLLGIAPVPMSKVFFTSSGSEATDTAIKLIWYRNTALGKPSKRKIIGRKNAYHGTTIAATSLSGISENHMGFGLPIDDFLHVGCPHYFRYSRSGENETEFSTRLAEELDALICKEGPETVAAFFAEPVMGAGGILLPPEDYFPKVENVLKKHDVLLVADEVICGFGRTGNMWGTQTFGLNPDIITCGKALSSGYQPISAVLISEESFRPIAEQSRRDGMLHHGFTFGGHPVTAAVALETLRIYEEIDLLACVKGIEPEVRAGIEAFMEHPLAGEIKSLGALSVIELVADKDTGKPFSVATGLGKRLIAAARNHGLILRVIGNRVGFSPPLISSPSEIREMYTAFSAALDDLAMWLSQQRGID